MITFSHLGNYGRFGNQLWQIASTIGIAIKNNQRYVFPHWEYQDYFKNRLPTAYLDNPYEYHEGFENPYYRDITFLDKLDYDLIGYFQSWKYFKDCQAAIHYYFEFDKTPLNGVAVHVRRGDYVNLQHIHPIQTVEYYRKAMSLFPMDSEFHIFSDDISWCIQNIRPMYNWKINYHAPLSDIEDFQTMASFSKFVISNSSYSWWAAWLSRSENVVAPKNWVVGETRDDRVPPEWIRL